MEEFLKNCLVRFYVVSCLILLLGCSSILPKERYPSGRFDSQSVKQRRDAAINMINSDRELKSLVREVLSKGFRLRQTSEKLYPNETIPWLDLAAAATILIENWCAVENRHAICGEDYKGDSSIYILTEFKLLDSPRPVFDPKEGAKGILLVNEDWDFFRIYLNADNPVQEDQFVDLGDGSSGRMFIDKKNNRGLVTDSNFDLRIERDSRSLHVLSRYNPHLWWIFNDIRITDQLLIIENETDSFKEVWLKASYEELNEIQKAILER